MNDQPAVIEQLISSSSHRINNLLHRINSAEFLVDSGLRSNDLSKIGRGWQVVKRSQRRLNHLMANLLFVTQDFKPFRGQHSPMDIVSACHEEMKDTYGESCMVVHPGDAQNWQAELDLHYTKMVLQNLVTIGLLSIDADAESIKHQVVLSTKNLGNRFSIRIQFTPSNPVAEMDRLLDGEITSQKLERGMLEWFVANEIVAAQGGSIEFDTSACPHATILVLLPN